MADLYRVLGVSPDDDLPSIKRRYRELAKQLHPDRTGGDKAKTEEFQRVSIAYEILGDGKKRAEYDLRRADESAFSSSGSPFGSKFDDVVQRVATEGVTGTNWSELFSDLFDVSQDFQKKAPEHMQEMADNMPSFMKSTEGVLDALDALFGGAGKGKKKKGQD